MTNFTQNQEVQIGTMDNLPDGHNAPIPARVVAVDAVTPQGLCVIVLARVSADTDSEYEQIRQFDADGLCLNAMMGKDNPNAALYLDSNLYPRG